MNYCQITGPHLKSNNQHSFCKIIDGIAGRLPTDSIRLSPLNNSRGKNAAHSLKVGQFDRVAFKQAAERKFDQTFDYDRELKETFKYANTLKHGDYEQRLELKEEERKEQELKQQQRLELERQQKQQQEMEQSRKQDQSLGVGSGWSIR